MESSGPRRLGEAVWFLGEIPRKNDFEARKTPFYYMEDGQRHPDFLMDDTALAIRTDRGLAVVSGCSHAGICNICEYAREVTGEERLHAVLGGFHLLEDSDVLESTLDYFRKVRPDHLYPMHCTALPALARFYEAFGIEKLGAGDAVTVG